MVGASFVLTVRVVPPLVPTSSLFNFTLQVHLGRLSDWSSHLLLRFLSGEIAMDLDTDTKKAPPHDTQWQQHVHKTQISYPWKLFQSHHAVTHRKCT